MSYYNMHIFFKCTIHPRVVQFYTSLCYVFHMDGFPTKGILIVHFKTKLLERSPNPQPIHCHGLYYTEVHANIALYKYFYSALFRVCGCRRGMLYSEQLRKVAY